MTNLYYVQYALQFVGHALGLTALRVFCRLDVRGRENLAGLERGFIIASNHVSELDPFLVRAAFPLFSRFAPVYFVSGAKDNFKRFDSFGWRSFIYGGMLFELLGGYPIYKGCKDYAASLRNHLSILREKRTLCIFPEGRRTLDGGLGEGHGGVAYLSHASGQPIIPMAIVGVKGITVKDFLFRKRKVEIRIGKPISALMLQITGNPEGNDYKAGAELVMSAIHQLIEPELANKGRTTAFAPIRSGAYY